jgi:hypothetical protein
LWVSLDGNYWFGGTTSLNGVENDTTLQRNSRVGVTASIPLTRNQAIKLSYNNGAYISYGGNYQNVSVGWQYSWFGRPNYNCARIERFTSAEPTRTSKVPAEMTVPEELAPMNQIQSDESLRWVMDLGLASTRPTKDEGNKMPAQRNRDWFIALPGNAAELVRFQRRFSEWNVNCDRKMI